MGTASLVGRPEGNRRPETNPEAGKLCIGSVAPYQLSDAARTENSDFQHRDLAGNAAQRDCAAVAHRFTALGSLLECGRTVRAPPRAQRTKRRRERGSRA
jgi:hypothetical protein